MFSFLKKIFVDEKPAHQFELIIGSYQRANPGPFASGHCLTTRFVPGERIETFSGTHDLEMDINISNQEKSNMQIALLQIKAGMQETIDAEIPKITRDHVGESRKYIQKLRVYCSQSPLVKQLKGEWNIKDEIIDGYIHDVHKLANEFKGGVEFVFVPAKLNVVQERCRSNFENYFDKKIKCNDCDGTFTGDEEEHLQDGIIRCGSCSEKYNIGI